MFRKNIFARDTFDPPFQKPRFAFSASGRLPAFQANLTTTINQQRGSGSATFTRATAATVQDWEGRVYSVLSGEVRFQGARRLRNLVNGLSEFAAATTGWTVGVLTATPGQSDPVNGTSAVQLVSVGAGDNAFTEVKGVTTSIGDVLVFSFWARVSVGAFSLPILIDDGSGHFAANPASVTAALTTTWKRFSFSGTAPGSWVGANTRAGFGGFSSWATVNTVFVYGAQVENVTGQSNQNPSEYVSVGVLAAPYHGLNVDGCKAFSTQNGQTVASNVVTDGTGAAISSSILLGYLSEQQSTNLVLQSENFGTTWAAVGTPTRVAANTNCGGVVLDLIGDDSAAALEGYTQTITFTGNAVKAVSIFFAQGTSTSSVVRLRDTTAPADRLLAAITWAVGVPTVTMTTGTLLGVDTLGNSCFRARVLTSAVTAANTNSLQCYPATDAALSVANTGNINFGGVQAEDVTGLCTSYIPTTTATVTRNVDNLTDPSSGNAITTSGTVYCETTKATISGNGIGILSINDGTSNNRADLRSAASPNSIVSSGGVQQSNVTSGGTMASGVTAKAVIVWDVSGGDNCYCNGTGGTQSGAITAPASFTTIQVGNIDGGTGNTFNGCIRNVKIWTRALTPAQIAAL